MLKKLGYFAAIVGGILIFALSGQIGEYLGKSAVQNYNEGRTVSVIAEAQAAAAQAIRPQLPMRIDEVTTWQSVVATGELLIYNYLLDYSEQEIDKTIFLDGMKKNLLQNACSEDGMANTIRIGARYMYTYMDLNGKLLGRIEINSDECKF